MNVPADLAAEGRALRTRLQQQRLVAGFAAEALRSRDFAALLEEAARVAAEGLGTELAKVLEYVPRERALLIRAGVGWAPGVVGVIKFAADAGSPAGFALQTGAPVISNHLAQEQRFRTPQVLAEHGVRRAINVLVRGEADGPPFGVLEADSRRAAGSFSPDDVAFLQGLANILGLAADLERERAARDLLMREVHHRVRNSLQIAQTVLRLQARAPGAEAAREPLEEAAQRVMTIAAVHQRLYAGPSVGRVALLPYLQGLIEDLAASTGAAASGRAVRLEVAGPGEAAVWDADRATTLGLVTTELVTNALKYGAGAVTVRFESEAEEQGAARLMVEDEGAGPPEGFDPRASRGLGMRLLGSLLRGGSLALERAAEGRTRFVATLARTNGNGGGVC